MANEKYDYGMIGLGTMGRNLAYNMNDHGYSVAGYDKTISQVDMFKKESGSKMFATTELNTFLNALNSPKVILMLVPAGEAVDNLIDELTPSLSANDILIDCGNSHFSDTDSRIKKLVQSNIQFMGIGISGGEEGARKGPSIMPGGSKDSYAHISKMLDAISAKVNGEPCTKWLGPGSAGHYVKMVHNGIEYGMMQLISEAYHLLKVVGGMSNDELHQTFLKWNKGVLHSFLIEITADIFSKKDDLTNNSLVDVILDNARQNGTGGWTSEDAMKLQVPIPVIDIAVTMRDLSSYKDQRVSAQQILGVAGNKPDIDKNALVMWLEQALCFSFIISYAQGMSLLHFASKEYKYDLNLEDIASIWRGGCIIRSSLLDDIRSVFSKQPDSSNFITDESISRKLTHSQIEIRKVIQIGVEAGIPIPGLMNALSYFDGLKSGWLPANLVQAQRDYFGAHTYERIDRSGKFHTHWESNS